ncbi:MAG: hypothetical protein K2Y22_09890 [Candidatus Obscuribacterales bacterium]|nr:hypothetical protein [Candidatus Obscuribacterales bacterium]
MRITFNYRDLKITEDECLQILDIANESTEEFDMKTATSKQPKRPAHINKAMKDLRSYARSEMSKTEIVQFRVDKSDFETLVEAASKLQMPMGAMVRHWVLEKLGSSAGKQAKKEDYLFVAERTSELWQSSKPKQSTGELAGDLLRELASLKKRIDKLESKAQDKSK